MGDAVNDRKKAKADYLAQLAKQKQQAQELSSINGRTNSADAANPSGTRIEKTTRDQILEQRRKEFEKRKNSGHNAGPYNTDSEFTNDSLGVPGAVRAAPAKRLNLFSGGPSESAAPLREIHFAEVEHNCATVAPRPGDLISPRGVDPPATGHALQVAVRSDVVSQQTKQGEYARQLRQEGVAQCVQDDNRHGQYHHHSNQDSVVVGNAGGFPNKHDARAAQRAKQEEYARQLQLDQNRLPISASQPPIIDSPHRHIGHNSSHSPRKDGFQFGQIGANADDKSKQREKQEAYARQLQEDEQHSRQLQPDKPNVPAGQRDLGYNSGGKSHYIPSKGLAGGAGDKEQVRAKHDEYDRQLQMDQLITAQLQQQERGDNPSNRPQGLSGMAGIGNQQNQDRASHKAKQVEYALLLQMDQKMGPVSNNNHGMNHGHHQPMQQVVRGNDQHLFGGPGGGAAADNARALQRQRQEEYARQLQLDQMNAATSSNMPHNRAHHQNNQYNANAPYDNSALSNVPSRGDEKAMQKARQEEYARQLQMDMQRKAIINPNNADVLRRNRPQDFTQAFSNGGQAYQQQPPVPQDGFVIGPLGLPVRRTLDVGNRGQQRAFSAQSSPPKISQPPGPTYNQPYGGPNVNYDPNAFMPPNMQVYSDTPHQIVHGAVPYGHPASAVPPNNSSMPPTTIGGLQGDVQDERDFKQKQQKLEHARALEAQIYENKRRIEEEKRLEAEMDLMLQQKIEQEQRELALKFDEEKKKAAIEEERKRQLEIQIAENKKQKELEDKKAQELEEKETAKALAGAEELARRERIEIENERKGLNQAQNSSASTSAGPSGNVLKASLFDQPSSRPYHPEIRPAPNSPSMSSRADSSSNPQKMPTNALPFEIVGEDGHEFGDVRGNLFAPPSPENSNGVKPVSRSAGSRSKLKYKGANKPNPSSNLESSIVVPLPPPALVPSGNGLFDGQGDDDNDEDMGESLEAHRRARRNQNQNGSGRNHAVGIGKAEDADENPLIKRFQSEAEKAKQEALDAKKELDKMRKLLQEKEMQEAVLKEQRKQQRQEERQRQKSERHTEEDRGINTIVEHPHKSPKKAKPFAGIFEKPPQPLSGDHERLELHPSLRVARMNSPQQSASLSDLNAKTLKSDSRFVFPDGTTFNPSTPDRSKPQSSSSSRSKGTGNLSPMKEDMTNRLNGIMSHLDGSDSSTYNNHVSGKIHLPPRNIIKCPTDGEDNGGRYVSGKGNQAGGDVKIRPSTVDYGASRGGSRRRQKKSEASPSKPKRSVRKYINADLNSSNENNVQFFNKESDVNGCNDETQNSHGKQSWHDATSSVEPFPHHFSSRNKLSSKGLRNDCNDENSDYDIDGTLRKNRRKLDLLSKISEGGKAAGIDELDMLLSMNDISSRPTTTASTRPATMRGNSKFIPPGQSMTHASNHDRRSTPSHILDLVDNRQDRDPYAPHPSRPSTSAAHLLTDEEISTVTIQRLSKDFSKDMWRADQSIQGSDTTSSSRRHHEHDRQLLRSAGQEVIGGLMKKTEWNERSSVDFITPRSEVPVPTALGEGLRPTDATESKTRRAVQSAITNRAGDSFIDFSEFGF